jgi:hypothetical protein
MSLALKLSLIPLVVWLASEAGRRWGHGVTGWITGLPLIAAPISIFLALDPGIEFAADTAHAILQTTPASSLHCLAFALAARRFGWIASLLIAWSVFFATSFVITLWVMPVGLALIVTLIVMTFALFALPRTAHSIGPVSIPRGEIMIRMVFALAIAASATLLAASLGTRVSGILLSFPISGTVLPAFTLALYGAAATNQLIRGFLLGLYGFALFFFVVATLLSSLGMVPTYLIAAVAAATLTLIITHLYSRLGLHRNQL